MWVRLAVQRLFLNVCLGEGRRRFVELEEPCRSVLCFCAVIRLWCPRALRHSPNGSTLCAIFIKPSGITIVVREICSTVIEFTHLPGLLLLRQSHISAAHGLQKIMWQWYHLLTYCWPVWSFGKWDFWAPPCVFGARVCTVKSKGNTDGSRVKLAAAVKKQSILIIIKQQHV